MYALSKTTYNLQNTVDTRMKEHLITLDRVGYISTRTLSSQRQVLNIIHLYITNS